MPFHSILVLEDGSIFHGEGFGEEKVDVGEIVFNTSMTGYQEIITDPSYKKQIITFTHPHIGNTGINDEDHESNKIHASGLVVKEFCTKPSNWRSQKTLEEFLIEQNVMAISGINTRQLTQIIREKGSMACCIGSSRLISEAEALQEAKSFSGLEGLDLAKEVSSAESYKWNQGVWPEYKESSNKNGPIVAYDFGIKTNILRLLSDYAGEVHVVNAKTSFDEVMELSPRGIFLSNGPGDPEPCTYAIENIKKFLDIKIPIFGICLGHQLLALAGGAKTHKMKFGHHGANHPVQDIKTKEVMITSQNHGFAVDIESLPDNIRVSHISLFDQSLQGIEFQDTPAFSFQGHPEASPGPQEIQILFSKFKSMVDAYVKT
ncbi:glutamine-hydrolyzing carbamoyl-phosphate synthase small subunit [Gammaproteobacteria bacterium]|nr:glutamine-hydrolyzing carbamoyl-phosphate synthase small subunit [Gammaproteobacteria bacterium]MDA9133670.1 glutamine-hydrolyzing carbamoyl-phosphate synthase small subunit [Gammaproteobacteria bacterium]MDA9577534.1 glutamine-hydrolyzing carbamoyl-phosphate synthase small subunit [Gammaproteobacteria bacterium]